MPIDRLGSYARPEGIANPPIDELLDATGLNGFAVVMAAAKRARQLTSRYTDPYALLDAPGPLVETMPDEPALTTALNELSQGNLLEVVEPDPHTADSYES